MDDCISREIAIDNLCEDCFMQNCSHDCDVVKILRTVPATNVRPVVHGEWEPPAALIPVAYDIAGVITWASEMRCSKCGFLTKVIEGKISQYNFCPSCGADMRPREENNNEN